MQLHVLKKCENKYGLNAAANESESKPYNIAKSIAQPLRFYSTSKCHEHFHVISTMLTFVGQWLCHHDKNLRFMKRFKPGRERVVIALHQKMQGWGFVHLLLHLLSYFPTLFVLNNTFWHAFLTTFWNFTVFYSLLELVPALEQAPWSALMEFKKHISSTMHI